jgi:glycerate kinase
LFWRVASVESHLRNADLVVTAEGCIDDSTFMGKGVGEVAWRCQEKDIPCIAFGGDVATRKRATKFFTEAHALVDVTTMKNAKAKPAVWLEQLAEQTAARLKSLNLRTGDR